MAFDGRALRAGRNPWPSLRERLFSRLELDPSGCVLWTGGRFPTGYGSIAVNGRSSYVHRLMYEMFVGSIPPGYQIDHLCRIRHCASPAHLEAVPQLENIRRDWHRRWDARDGL